jgi:3',5'-cyclic-AMP phosphodiesterase
MDRFDEDKAMNENEAAAQPGDSIDRRNFLGCMAWVSTDLLWTMAGGVPTSKLLAQAMKGGAPKSPKSEDFPSSRLATVTSASTREQTRM